MKHLPYVALLSLLVGCNSNDLRVVQIDHALDSLKVVFAPDPRTAVFNVRARSSRAGILLSGEVDNPKAKEAVFEELQRLAVTDAVDSIALLPDSSLRPMLYGIVDVSVGNVYSAPRDASELVNQVLLGHTVSVLKKVHGGWLYIKSSDGYLGWIDAGNIVRADSSALSTYIAARKLIVTTVFTTLRVSPSGSATLSDAVMADLLEPEGTTSAGFRIELPDGRIGYASRSDVQYYDEYLASHAPTPEAIEVVAKELLGFPYLWGGTSAKAMDCSGFTKTVFRMSGIALPRDANQQAEVGQDIDPGPDFSNLKKGDLLFFGQKGEPGKKEKIVHVGIYLGNGHFIHSSSLVRISSLLKGDSLFDQYDFDRFVRAKRILSENTAMKTNNNNPGKRQ